MLCSSASLVDSHSFLVSFTCLAVIPTTITLVEAFITLLLDCGPCAVFPFSSPSWRMLLHWLSQKLPSCYYPIKNLSLAPNSQRKKRWTKWGREGKSHPWYSKLFTIKPPQYYNINFQRPSLNSLLQIAYSPNIILTFLSLPFYLSLFTYQKNCIPFFKVKCTLSLIFPDKNDLSFSVISYHLTFLMLVLV